MKHHPAQHHLLAIAITSIFATGALAQSHCQVGAPIDPAALPPPRSIPGIGTGTLPITTKSAEAQAWFDQGVRLLHAFWDIEAYRAFREAARLDPDAAMPQWGLFTALGFNAQEQAEERSAALERAIALGERATERERYYIRAASYLADPAKGRPAYIAEMEALIDRYPADVEAKLFLANLLSTPPGSYAPNGRPREGKLYGQSILRNLLVTHPDHAAVHHYWIHAVENGPRPEEALDSARKLPKLAPGSGHLLHMPGHIYYRLGRFAEAREAFLAATRRELAYMKEQNIDPVSNWNYTHNLDYLVGNCAEDGRYEEGLRWATELESIAVAGRLRARGAGYILYGAHTARARLQMRYGLWDAAAESLAETRPHLTSSPRSANYLDAVLAFARGMGAVMRTNLARANEQLAALVQAQERLNASEPAPMPSDWYLAHAKRIAAVHELELRGAILSAEGKHEDAIAKLRQAVAQETELGYWEPPHYARPIQETLASAHLHAGQYDQAIEAWIAALERRPNSGHALFGLARTYAMAGRPKDAQSAYARFRTAWEHADRTLPQFDAFKN